MPLQPCQIHLLARPQRHVDDVLARLLVGTQAVVDTGDVVASREDALGQQEAGRQLEVVSRRPHRHADGDAADANLERLLDRDGVMARAIVAGVPLDDRRDPGAFKWLWHELRSIASSAMPLARLPSHLEE